MDGAIAVGVPYCNRVDLAGDADSILFPSDDLLLRSHEDRA